MDEVLPTIRKTGTYSVPKQEENQPTFKEYEYFDKTYNGQPVISLEDFEHFTGMAKHKAYTTLTRFGKIGTDYFHLDGSALADFKLQNPIFPKASVRWLVIITKSGFEKVVKAYDCKNEAPECFRLTTTVPKQSEYAPHKEIISLMGYVDRYTVLINEYRKRLLQPSTIAEAEMNRKELLSAMKNLRSYSIDVETIILH